MIGVDGLVWANLDHQFVDGGALAVRDDSDAAEVGF